MHHRIGLAALVVFALVGCVEPSRDPAQSPIVPAAGVASAHVDEPLFVNASFETGNLSNWTVTTWLTPGTGVTAYPVTAESQLGLTAGGLNKTVVADAGAPYSFIPPGLTAADPPRYPRFGLRAAIVNEMGKNNNANKMTQSSVVTTADVDPADGLVHVRFTVLPVLQNPGHTVIEQPFYFVSVTNTTKGTTLTARFNFSNEAGVPWQSNAAGSIVFTDWLLFDLPLARNAVSIGDTLTATIIAGGCAPGGHWGEAIVDAFGSSIPGLVVYGSGPDSVEAGSDFQYTYRVLNGGTSTTTGTKLTAYLPAGVTFRSVDTPGVTCTVPTVGTRGTVVCELGAVAAGASRIIKLTVRADATATGVIRHGWYLSQSNQDAPLTGPLISTNVTTGGTTQYVDLVTTIVDAASSLAWGQHNTWSVTVRNDGSATATAAGITTNLPAQLSNLAWTCTPQAGASCTASGVGALNTNATIPAGKSVTYTVDADVIAGSGTGLLSFTANATAPAGTVERYALDNGSGDDDTLAGSVVSVTVNRTGNGTVISSPAGVDCGAGCASTTASFANGAQLTLQAVPGVGSVFAGWSGGTCTGTAACTFNAAAGQTVTATFSPNPIAITSPATAKAAVGRPFTYTVTAIGTAPIALAATNLPGWLSFDAATGILSGTSPASGVVTVNLSATDVNGTALQSLVITSGVPPTITSATTFNVATNTAWEAATPIVKVTATGDATISFNVSNLPGLVYFNSTTGAFTGNAGADGVYNVPVIATNAFGSAYKVIAVSVGGAPVITSALANAATVGTPWTYTLTATGTPTITSSVSQLPAWASYNSTSHVISGTPTSAGTLGIGLRAQNAIGFSQQTLFLTVDGPAVITSGLAASGTAGTAFTYSLTAEGSAPITRTMTGLPAWATFDPATGLLSGTPPSAGSFTITVGASNSVGSDSKTLTITIAAPPPTPTPPLITSPLLATGALTMPFTYTITADGQVPMTFSASGLPTWATFTAATGTISGTPDVGGSTNVTIGAQNGLGTDSKTLVLSVPVPAHLTSGLAASGVVGQAFTYTVMATGTAPVTLSALGLPSWASFDPVSGAITGTPTGDGSYNVTIGASNGAGSDSKILVLTVRTAPTITSALSASAVVGAPFTYTLTSSGTAPLTLSASSLPAWATFTAATGVISGTPTADGTFNITLGSSNAAGSDGKTLVLTVRTGAAITSGLASSGVVGAAFTYTLTASGTSPLTLSASNLPAWANFTPATGVISGTPTADGTFNITLGASNVAGSDGKTLVLTVRTVPVITSALAASAVVGASFTYTLTSTGTAPLTLSASSLPSWATFTAATGVISGTPTADGTFNIALGASNAAGSDSQTLVLTVRTGAAITSALSSSGIVGTSFTYTLTASGTAPLTLSASNLPAWASFDAASGAITGTPTVDGTFNVTLGASNAAASDSKTLVLTVRTAPAITSALVASGVVGAAFTYTLTASGTAPVALLASSLPSWATFTAATGVISGTPTADGTFNITLGASNAAGSEGKTLVLTVRTSAVITSGLVASGVVGTPFTYTLTASGTGPIALSASGLPAWASFDPATGIISGTPTADGTFNVTLGVSNSAASDSKTLVLTVRTAPAITSALVASGVVGTAFTYTLTSSGTAPVTLSATGLPSWATFTASTGVISGTPTSAAVFTITLGASNAAGTDSKSLTITTSTSPLITSALTAAGVVGTPFTYTLTASGSAPMTLSATGLPAWATFTAATGIISGTPTADAVITITLGASNAAGSDSKSLVLTVRTTPHVTSAITAAAVVGTPFSYTVTASGTGPLSFSVDTLPSWLSFNSATGALTGTPPANGTTQVILHVTNAAGTDTITLTVTAQTKPTVTNVLHVYGVVGGAFTFTLTATGSPTIGFTATGLPAGVTLSGATLSGTPSAAGSFQVTETASNTAGQHQVTLLIDVRAAVPAPSITLPAEGGVVNSTSVTVSGTAPTAEAGNTVHVTEGGNAVCDAVIQANGSWSCAVTLPEGAHTLSAVIVDVHGFTGTQVDTQQFTVDLTAPVAPAWVGPAASAQVKSSTPELSGTGEPGATVTVTHGGSTVCTALVQGDGTWHCTPTAALPDGSVTLSITQRDAAGNVSPAAERTITIDTALPVAPTITAPVAGALLHEKSPLLGGTAEANSTVKVFVDGQLVCTTQADATGHFECHPSSPLGEGAHTVEALSVDAAGNEGARGSSTFTIDSEAPVAPTLTGPAANVTVANPTVTGTAEPGSTVTVTLDGQPLCTTTADANGQWSCPTTGLADGTHTVTATARDAAGNESTTATGTFVVQTPSGTVTPPTTTTASTDNGHVEGDATPNANVNVYVDGQLVGTTTADADGHWGFDLPVLPVGPHRVSIGVLGADGSEYRSGEVVVVVERPGIDFGGGIGCNSTSQAPVGLLALVLLSFLSRRRRAVATVAAAAALVAAPSFAQVAVSDFELEQLTLNPSARGGLVVGGADLLAPNDFRIAASFGYQYAPLKYFENGVLKATPVEHRMTVALGAAASVLPWLELGVTVPVVVYQDGSAATSRSGDLILSSVPSQASLGTPWLQGRLSFMQERDGSPLDLGVTMMLGLPLGSGAGLTRETIVSGQLLAGVGRTFGAVRVAAEVGAHLRENVVLDGADAVGSRVLLNAGASTVGGKFRGELSVRSFIPLTKQPVSAELLAGVRYAIDDWELFGIAGPGFGNAPGTPMFRAVVGVSFGGIKSAHCGGRVADPAQCPGLDADGDGVLNGVDACPTVAAATENGCPAPQPEPVVEPVVVAPPVDTDGDGVTDSVDACPAVAGSQADGCPPPAPVVAEEPAKPAPQVELKNDHLELRGSVYFDTGKAVLQARSFPLLDEVAAVMKAHPDVKKVSVEGHTDAQGNAAFNQRLSLARAKAVKTYLEQHGIEAERLQTKGFGQSKPIASHATPEGREKNRRVEFIVLP